MHPRHPAATVGALLTALVVGGLVAVQSHANGQLAVELGAGLLGATGAAVVSFGIGLLLLCLLCAAFPRARRGLYRVVDAARSGRLRPWQLIGGMSGALLVVSQGFTVATIGVALFTVAVVAGQTSSALLADKVGAGPAGPAPITLGRGIGAALAVAAVALAVSGRLQGAAALAPAALALTALPLLAGAGAAWQQAVNGQVSVVGGPFAAAWLNFFVGATALTVLVAVGAGVVAPGDIAAPPPVLGPAWWLYAGGPIGVVFISAAAVLVRVLGVLVFGLCAISGQVITAVLVDLVLADIGVGVLTLSGATLTLVGVGVATLSGRHARGTRM
ncbi:MAG: DMT family transporter [Nocardioidaceae bacterium]